MSFRPGLLAAGLAVALAGCAGPVGVGSSPTPEASVTESSTPLPPNSAPPTARPTAVASSSSPWPSATEGPDDPRWRFYTDDRTRYASPWYDGRHRLMIDFGCTPAPYYRADARCSGGQGFHHGIDVALPCGTPLRAAVGGRIVTGGVGAAYGEKAFRIRTDTHDLLIAHARTVVVRDGERVTPGQLLGEAGALGAPDGCHLHLEQRTIGGGVSSATDPRAALALRP